MVTKSKELYEAPATSVMELHLNGFLCQSLDLNGSNVFGDPVDYVDGGDPLNLV